MDKLREIEKEIQAYHEQNRRLSTLISRAFRLELDGFNICAEQPELRATYRPCLQNFILWRGDGQWQ